MIEESPLKLSFFQNLELMGRLTGREVSKVRILVSSF